MDQHLLKAFMEALADTVADKVVERLRPHLGVASPVTGAPLPPLSTSPEVPTELPEYLTTKQAAELLNLSPGGLENMRCKGGGPKFVKIGRRIRYRLSDLKEMAPHGVRKARRR